MNKNYLTKICKECLLEKELSDFYKHPKGVLGTLPRCKSCICKGRKTEKERAMAKISDKKRSYTIKRKRYMAKKLVDFRNKNPEKYLAQRLVANYWRKHKNEKPNICFVSGENGKIQLHHFDYTKPNYVIPCTSQIHSDFHTGKIKDIKKERILILPF